MQAIKLEIIQHEKKKGKNEKEFNYNKQTHTKKTQKKNQTNKNTKEKTLVQPIPIKQTSTNKYTIVGYITKFRFRKIVSDGCLKR